MVKSKNKLFFFSILFFLFTPLKISKGCGPYDLSFYGYSFVNPKIINLEAKYATYFAGFEEVFNQIKTKDKVQERDNMAEWHERFCGIPEPQDMYQLIYKMPLQQIEVLKTAIRRKNAALPTYLARNTFAVYLKNNKCTEAVDYLIYAKKCEPHVIVSSGWDMSKRDTVGMEFLIKDGLRDFKKTKSHYFRLRYAYQIIRLAHYKKNYRQTLDLYEYLLPKTDNDPSILDYWIEGHRAGALMGLGDNVQAAYIYAQVFQNCPSKRATAFRSFRISSDEEWMECLKLCEDDHERATLYALRASGPNSQVVPEMEEIYYLDKDNENLELLLVREIQRLEKDLLGLNFNKKKRQNKRIHNIPRKEAGQRVIALQNLVRGIIREGKIENLTLWRIADGYLELIAGDYYAAQRSLKRLQDTVEDEILKEQLEAMMMVANLYGFEDADAEMEAKVVEYRKNPLYRKYPDFENFTNDKLRHLYEREGLVGKSFLFDHDVKDLKFNPQLEVLDELIGLCKKENRTKLEEALVVKADGTTIESDLYDIKGTFYLSQYKLESALETFRQMPRTDRDNYAHENPFRSVINDCINCRIVDTASYNKIQILERLVELEYRARADEEKGALYYYRIGTALYNISYFGHAWRVSDYFRSGASWDYLKTGQEVFSTSSSENGNRETVNCALPLFYFDKAYRLSNSRELAARAAFMAAKCEQNIFYTTKGSDYSTYSNFIPDVPSEFRRYFDILVQHYDDTEFYEQVIEECLYFERYAARY